MAAATDPCLCFDPGRLRHKVELVAMVETRDDTGHVTKAPEVIARPRAEIITATTQDLWQAMQVQTKVSHRITIRYRTGVNGTMHFRFRGQRFNIVGEPLNLLQMNVWLVCMCCQPDQVGDN